MHDELVLELFNYSLYNSHALVQVSNLFPFRQLQAASRNDNVTSALVLRVTDPLCCIPISLFILYHCNNVCCIYRLVQLLLVE